MAHVYHWKHGWIPLDHTAALSKAHGNHDLARRYTNGAESKHAGIRSRQDVAGALRDLPNVPAGDREQARNDIIAGAHAHGAEDLLPSHLRSVDPRTLPTAGVARSQRNLEQAAHDTGLSAAKLRIMTAIDFNQPLDEMRTDALREVAKGQGKYGKQARAELERRGV